MCNLLLHMVAPGAPIASDTFLTLFGTPLTVAGAELCRVRGTTSLRLERSGCQGHEWYDVRVTVAAREDNPQWQGWCVESDGQTPWEGAQVAAFEVLSGIG